MEPRIAKQHISKLFAGVGIRALNDNVRIKLFAFFAAIDPPAYVEL